MNTLFLLLFTPFGLPLMPLGDLVISQIPKPEPPILVPVNGTFCDTQEAAVTITNAILLNELNYIIVDETKYDDSCWQVSGELPPPELVGTFIDPFGNRQNILRFNFEGRSMYTTTPAWGVMV